MIQLSMEEFHGDKRNRLKVVNTMQSFNRQSERASAIIYYQPLGELYFNQNGREPGLGNRKESGLFAILKGAPELNRADIGLM